MLYTHTFCFVFFLFPNSPRRNPLQLSFFVVVVVFAVVVAAAGAPTADATMPGALQESDAGAWARVGSADRRRPSRECARRPSDRSAGFARLHQASTTVGQRMIHRWPYVPVIASFQTPFEVRQSFERNEGLSDSIVARVIVVFFPRKCEMRDSSAERLRKVISCCRFILPCPLWTAVCL